PIELDHRVARRARRLLVRSEECVLERRDQGVAFDALVPLELVDELDDLSTHVERPSSIRFPRTICAYGMSTSSPSTPTVTASSSARTTSPRTFDRSAVFSFTVWPTTRWKCSGLRSGRSRPGDETSTAYFRR